VAEEARRKVDEIEDAIGKKMGEVERLAGELMGTRIRLSIPR